MPKIFIKYSLIYLRYEWDFHLEDNDSTADTLRHGNVWVDQVERGFSWAD